MHVHMQTMHACREPSNMSSDNDERPDGHIITPRDNITTDVVIANPLWRTHCRICCLSTTSNSKERRIIQDTQVCSISNSLLEIVSSTVMLIMSVVTVIVHVGRELS